MWKEKPRYHHFTKYMQIFSFLLSYFRWYVISSLNWDALFLPLFILIILFYRGHVGAYAKHQIHGRALGFYKRVSITFTFLQVILKSYWICFEQYWFSFLLVICTEREGLSLALHLFSLAVSYKWQLMLLWFSTSLLTVFCRWFITSWQLKKTMTWTSMTLMPCGEKQVFPFSCVS